MDIKPIETVYNGYRFRSRLEARWAVFFDAAGIKYEYEPEGFEYSRGDGEKCRYLPDFFLPELEKYVEVKGSKESLLKDFHKLALAIDWDATPIAQYGLLILGQIPNYEKMAWGNVPMFTYLFRGEKGVRVEHAIFWEGFHCTKAHPTRKKSVYVIGGNDSIISKIYGYPHEYIDAFSGDIPNFVTTEEMYTHSSLRSFSTDKMELLISSYKAARQARFEHGETPKFPKETPTYDVFDDVFGGIIP